MRYDGMSSDKYTQVRYSIAKEWIKNVVYRGAKALDIGCYDGYFLSQLPDIDGYGLDTDGQALAKAYERGIKPFDPEEKYDIVICMEVLEHTVDPKQMLRMIKGLLKPYHMVIISIPNECNLWARIRMLLGWGINDLPFDPEYHLHFPTIKQGEDLIKQFFEIRRKKAWVYGLPQFFSVLPNLFARGVVYECH